MTFFGFMGIAYSALLACGGFVLLVSYWRDQGYLVFRSAIEKLGCDPVEWDSYESCSLHELIHRPSGLVVKFYSSYGSQKSSTCVSAGQHRMGVQAGLAWALWLDHAATRMLRQKKRTKRLHAICDTIDALDEKGSS